MEQPHGNAQLLPLQLLLVTDKLPSLQLNVMEPFLPAAVLAMTEEVL